MDETPTRTAEVTAAALVVARSNEEIVEQLDLAFPPLATRGDVLQL